MFLARAKDDSDFSFCFGFDLPQIKDRARILMYWSNGACWLGGSRIVVIYFTTANESVGFNFMFIFGGARIDRFGDLLNPTGALVCGR